MRAEFGGSRPGGPRRPSEPLLVELLFNGPTWNEILERLTRQERRVLFEFLLEPNDVRVASRLGSRPQTVRNQIASIREKLDASSRVHLAIIATAALVRSESV